MLNRKNALIAGVSMACLALLAANSRPYRWWILNDMAEQPIVKPFEGLTLLPPEGSVAVEDWDPAPDRMQFITSEGDFFNPVEATAESVKAGEDLYNIYCIACHGKEMRDDAGYKSKVQEKGMPGLNINVVKIRNDAYIYSTMSHGSAIMNRLSYHLSPEERWHVVNYIRHLQNQMQ